MVPYPPFATVEQIILKEKRGNCVPIFVQLPADLLTPCTAYLRIAKDSKYSFLLESVIAGENIARYSFIGAGEYDWFSSIAYDSNHGRLCATSDPLKVIKTGPNEELTGDPMTVLQKELAAYRYVKLPEVPTFTGGAVGYVAYDSIQHFEPKTKCELKDTLGIPEAVFMVADTLVVYDHLFQNIKVVSHVFAPSNSPQINLAFIYHTAVEKTRRLARILLSTSMSVPEPLQPPIVLGQQAASNVGKDGYESFVTDLRQHIVAGDIIQAVPSQRLARPTSLHPFNAYRQLRQVNPSPYMFYMDCGELQIVGASPETLCKVEKNKVYNHAIAGTTKRGKTPEGMESTYLSIILSHSPWFCNRGRTTG